MNAPRHHLPRWTLSLALVLGLHIGIAVLALNWRTWLPGAEGTKTVLVSVKSAVYTVISQLS